MKPWTVMLAAAILAVPLLAVAAALALGGPKPIKPMQSIGEPFRQVDFSALEPLARYTARDGAQLSYRYYAPPGKQPGRGSVVLVHGSSANSRSMHPLAQSFAQAGYTVYALDMRGHGESGTRGDIAYIGQLEDDLADFIAAVHPASPKTLVGFSAGGGFALRFASGARQGLFDNYLLMAPYIGRDAANNRPDAGGWVSLGIPRLAALSLLNRLHITAFNHLGVVAFAVDAAPAAQLTPGYSYALLANFQPRANYQRDIRNIHSPVEVLEGQDDEVFIAAKLAQVLADAGRHKIPVTLVPAVNHIGLTLAPAARAAAVSAVGRLDAAMPPARS